MSTNPHITPDIAAHVLFHLGHGGRPGNRFIQELLATFDDADAHDLLQLAAGFPGYAAAFELAKNHRDGVDILAARAADDH
ncbi:hypothetical protein ACGF0J_14115 [Nonomuraea sp. NPDC047897]|uniref:hypothetical protein n=1 Tax=Nonomuraea sp. NPDC047897 TaxID=3364346 RepID=UPI0037239FC7